VVKTARFALIVLVKVGETNGVLWWKEKEEIITLYFY